VRAARLVLIAGGIALLVHVLQARQSDPLLVQGLKNLNFARRPLAAALDGHGWLRPPLYPLVLWVSARVGIQPLHVNELLFLATLGLVVLWARRELPAVHPLAPVLLLAVAHFNHTNVHQPVAETLFVLLLLGLVIALRRYQETASGVDLALVTGNLMGLGLTRYLALAFPLPPAALHVVAAPALPLPRRWRAVALALALAVAPIAVWMTLARSATGYLTGDDRRAPRDLPVEVAHWREHEGLGAQARLAAKTLLIDFFCPRHHAGLAVVTRPHEPDGVEWVGAALLAAAGAVLMLGLARTPGPRAGWRSGGALLGALLIFFYGATLAIWTWGNNDPLHSRFLYPSYALLVLAGSHAFAFVKARGPGWGSRLPFLALYALLFSVQLWRSLQAVPLPIR
jgi:hypothetical protein